MSAVLELLGWPSESDVRDAAGCFWDAIRGVLVSCDSSKQLEIDKGCLMGMVYAGILFLSVDEFGDDSFTLNSAAIRWREHQIIEHGTTDPLHHLRPGAEQDHCKLSMVMLLASQGWRPIAEHAALDFHCVGGQLVFDMKAHLPKSYFVALAKADSILEKMLTSDSLPVIHHGLSDSYYKLLLKLRSADDVAKLDALLAQAPDVHQLQDEQFKALLPADEKTTDDDLELADGPAPDVILAPSWLSPQALSDGL